MSSRTLLVTAAGVAGLLLVTRLTLRVSSPIHGLVRDEHGPLAGAIVRVKTTEAATVTDVDGRFTLSGFSPAFAVRVTAWKDGYYIAGVDARPWDTSVEIALSPYTVSDNPDYTWILPAVETRSATEERLTQTGLGLAARVSFNRALLPLANRLTLGCRDCHGQTIYDQWDTSAHALGQANVRFVTMYNGTDVEGSQSPPTRFAVHRDYGRVPIRPDPEQPYYGPGFKLEFPEGTGNCATCHLPTAALGAPYATDPTSAGGVGARGAHCDFCHKIAAVKLDPTTGLPYENMPGILSIELMRPSPEPQLFFGPYDDVDVGPDTYLPLMKQSEICAPCHNAGFWGVPIYQSFAEWQASPYPAEGKTCQTCHMQPDGVTTNFAPGRGGLERDPDTIPTHNFPGAADEPLLQNTATMTVMARREGDQISVDVSVTNSEAGHHIPTDSPLRQIFVIVTATDERGRTLPLQSGPTLPDWAGDLAGQPGVYFAKILEQLWTETAPTGAYWTQTRLLEDTRLPALATDTSTYVFTASGTGQIIVEARLVFRRAYHELMHQKGWDTPDILMESRRILVRQGSRDDERRAAPGSSR